MMADVGIFRVEIGINDTALTRALEIGDYRTAVVIIREINAQQDPTMLDEGPYERIPLYIVLCGYDANGFESSRNLFVAKLLVENGANPNKRLPIYSLGVMVYASTLSHSPMELLLLFYSECIQISASGQWSSKQPAILGLDRQTKYSFCELKQQLLQLVDLFIAHGAEVNVYYRNSKPMMNYLLQTSPDVDLIQRLCDAGAAINSFSDCHGTTPIMSLCSGGRGEEHREEVVHYFLNRANVELNLQDCQGHNALWKALSQGNFEVAQLLANAGASHSASGYAYFPASSHLCDSSIFLAAEVPTLLAALVGMFRSALPASNGCCCAKWHQGNFQPNSNGMLLGTASIVDRGLPYNALLDIENSIGAAFPWEKGIGECWSKVAATSCRGTIVPSLLGHLTVSLRQLCVRILLTVFLQNFALTNQFGTSFSKHMPDTTENGKVQSRNSVTIETDVEPTSQDEQIIDKFETQCVTCAALFRLRSENMLDVVEALKLPGAFLRLFYLELYRWKLLTALGHGQHCRVPCSCSMAESLLELSDSGSSIYDAPVMDDLNEEEEMSHL